MAKENRKASLREEFESLQAERRARYLENLLKEAVLNVLAEQQQTPKPPPADPNALPPVPPPAPGTPPAAPPAVPTDPAAVPPPAPAPDPAMPPGPPADAGMGMTPPAPADSSSQPSVTALVDSLNVIRGGKSLTDPEVMGGISTVFKSLTAEQKQELTNILDMLSKAVAGTEQSAPETQGTPAPAVAPPPPPPAPPAPAQSPPPISPTGI